MLSNHHRSVRLLLRLLWYYRNLLDSKSSSNNYVDAADMVSETILALVDLLRLHSLPGTEWERLHELRKHCRSIQALLFHASTSRDTLLDGCEEALRQYCYLLEMEDIERPSLIEGLCLTGEDTVG